MKTMIRLSTALLALAAVLAGTAGSASAFDNGPFHGPGPSPRQQRVLFVVGVA
jgi:hypothetical protein